MIETGSTKILIKVIDTGELVRNSYLGIEGVKEEE